ncbi:hypothetical protein I79_011120 [Cricetulus griseus]|uniref:Uncharacterized protein n=1 Tax=Cricetulus griseus TaxID=10029 RepID=G3HKA2_CRIGR|nr:hypothetical protein I79_011120 [Cricetulus griseus]
MGESTESYPKLGKQTVLVREWGKTTGQLGVLKTKPSIICNRTLEYVRLSG